MALPNNPTQAQVVNEVKTLDNNAVYNAGTLSTVAGSSTSGSVLSVRWYNFGINGITTPYDGMKIMVRIPRVGIATAGVILSINGNNADDYHPVAYNVSTVLTSHYAVGSYKIFTYDASATMTCYKTAGTATTVTGVWKGEANYDSNNYACVRQYQHGANAVGTSPKYPILTRYNLTNKNGTYDTAYSRFRTDVTIDTSTGNLDAPTISENGVALSSKYQSTLVSGNNIKTINNESLLGSGDISIPIITTDQTYNSTSTNPQSGTAVAGALSPVVAIAEGKTKSYVIQRQSDITGTKSADDEYTNVTAITGVTIVDLKLGDIILIKDLNVPDYWVSQISPSISLSKMETTKVDLSDYVTLSTTQSISGVKTFTGGMSVSGRSVGSGDDEGIVVGRAANNYAGVCLGSPSGMRSVFYLTAANQAVWRWNNGSASFDIVHPNKAGTIALISDIPSAITSVDGLSGGTISGDTTINGNLDAHYVKSTWLYTSATTDNASWTDVYVNNAGWLYKRSKSSFKSDLGVPSDGVVNATASTNVKRDSSGNVNAVAFDLCSVGTSTVNAKMLYDSTNECIKFTF